MEYDVLWTYAILQSVSAIDGLKNFATPALLTPFFTESPVVQRSLSGFPTSC